jgi:hypothetical protein
MRKLFLAVLIAVAGAPVYAASQSVPDVLAAPGYFVTVSKAGVDGWKASLSVQGISPFLQAKLTLPGGREFVPKVRYGSLQDTASRDYPSGCVDGKPTQATVTTGRIVAVIDDQLVVTESRLVRMDRLQVGDCVALTPVVKLETWTTTLPTTLSDGAEFVPPTPGFSVVVDELPRVP